MRNITSEKLIPERKTACALGLFDGVHRGHQLVIGTACKAGKQGMESAVFTFKTDTVTTKGHDGMVEMLLDDREKFAHIERLGVDYLYTPDFEDMKNLSCESFVRDILKGRLNCAKAVCGADYRFGRGALGDSKRLRELGEKYGIEVTVLGQLSDEYGIISSTAIRQAIRSGKIEKANEMLGYTFSLDLPVEHGKALARTLDHPTINQVIPKGHVLPKFGVYCTRVNVGGKWYCGVTNVGIKPTVNIKTSPLAETYIIGFQGNLYGERVRVLFDRFVRPERKFADIDELKKHIAQDTQTAVDFYGNRKICGDENE